MNDNWIAFVKDYYCDELAQVEADSELEALQKASKIADRLERVEGYTGLTVTAQELNPSYDDEQDLDMDPRDLLKQWGWK